MRPLILHVSALNDAEYEFYTSSIADLVLDFDPSVKHDDAHYDALSLSLRETRAWLRGRYADIPIASVDAILRLFHPGLGPNDVLSGGQFFALLRLVLHVRAGRELDRTLAFVQAHPSTSSNRHEKDSSTPSTPRPYPASTAGRSPYSPHNPFLTRPTKSAGAVDPPPPPTSKYVPPLPPRRPSVPSLGPLVPPPRHASLLPAASLPILQKPALVKNDSGGKIATSTLMRQSLQASKTAQTMKRAEEMLEKERIMQVLKSSSSSPSVPSPAYNSPSHPHPHPPPPPPPRNRSTSPQKRDARSSSSRHTSRSTNSIEGNRPVLPQRRALSPAESSLSALSLDRIAFAVGPNERPPMHPARKSVGYLKAENQSADAAARGREVFSTLASKPTADDGSSSSSSKSRPEEYFSPPRERTRLARSESMRLPIPHTPPPVPPPPRRRRPESVQTLSSYALVSDRAENSALSRHLSLHTPQRAGPDDPPSLANPRTRSTPGGTPAPDSTLSSPSLSATFQKALTRLESARAHPALEKARSKAEAVVRPRRGYRPPSQSRSSHDAQSRAGEKEGLMRRVSDGGSGFAFTRDREGGEGADEDEDEDEWDSQPGVDRDHLKWPVSAGEGWKPL